MSQRSPSEKYAREERSQLFQAEALRFHETIVNASGLAVITTSPEGLITSFNGRAEQLLGYSAHEVVGKATPIIFHDADEIVRRAGEMSSISGKAIEPAFDVVIQKSRDQDTIDQKEWTFVRRNASRFTGTLTVITLRDDDDQVKGFAGIIADLSEQKKLMERIEISEEKFRLLAENIPGVIYLCNNDKNFSTIYVNDAVERITGYPTGDFMSGKINIAALFHPEDRDSIYTAINYSLAERKSFQLRYRIRHASGDWRWIDETGVGVFSGEKLIVLEGFLQDVTAQREADELLRQGAEENLRFFNSPVNLNAVVSVDGRLIRFSPSWTGVLGWSEQDMMTQGVMNLVHPDDLPRTQHELQLLANSTQAHTFEIRVMCKDGSSKWLLWAVAFEPTTQMIYASAIDISQRKESEETIRDSKSNLEGIMHQLQEQNRRLDEFAHIISHNLRAPVNNIQALINLLSEQSEITDYRLILDKVANVAKNLSETMNELMDALKAKAQPHVDMTEIRFKEVLDKVVQSLEGELIVAQASVTFDFNEAPAIPYSKPYLESIFQNLLTNAVKYRSPDRKPTIHFQSTVTGGHVELRVTDNGQGIDMEQFGDKLFGLHKTFHHHQEARGVGLFLVKTQIEALGGSISASSEVDKGTTFTIRFN